MTSIRNILTSIFAKNIVKHKWQADFLIELFGLVFSIQGRVNYTNLSRYSKYNELTFRRNYKKFFDWVNFNLALMQLAGINFSDPMIAVMDCSFIPKAGKKTFGLDKFFSGAAGRAKKGLEISLLSLIDVKTAKAWTLDVVQTPSNLSAKEGNKNQYTRIDFYLEQLADLLPKLMNINYFVADGFYAKVKVFDFLCQNSKHLITKLRPDANLRFLYNGPHPKGKKGRKRQYGDKVDWKNLDLRKWNSIGYDYKYGHIKIYTQILNSPRFKRNLRVVLLLNTKTNKYVLLACTDLNLGARIIVEYYQMRFQIEFLFRDAKQFTGLTHCQARDDESLDFHFNMSLSAINLVRLIMMKQTKKQSLNSFVRRAYNTRFAAWLFSKLSKNAKFDLNQPNIEDILSFGCLDRK